jgi:hypothetical protein
MSRRVMNLKLKELPLLGKENLPYSQRLMTEEEKKRKDIEKGKLYLVNYDGIWLIGRFTMVWYGWYFNPNLGSMGMQKIKGGIEWEHLNMRFHWKKKIQIGQKMPVRTLE